MVFMIRVDHETTVAFNLFRFQGTSPGVIAEQGELAGDSTTSTDDEDLRGEAGAATGPRSERSGAPLRIEKTVERRDAATSQLDR